MKDRKKVKGGKNHVNVEALRENGKKRKRPCGDKHRGRRGWLMDTGRLAEGLCVCGRVAGWMVFGASLISNTSPDTV